MNRNNISKKKQKSNKACKNLRPDFCPEINVDMKFGKGGLIIHNGKMCVAKPFNKTSLLYKKFNTNSKIKKNYLVKEHTETKEGGLASITFSAISTKEFKEKRDLFKKTK
jgi:hypothetical protein